MKEFVINQIPLPLDSLLPLRGSGKLGRAVTSLGC